MEKNKFSYIRINNKWICKIGFTGDDITIPYDVKILENKQCFQCKEMSIRVVDKENTLLCDSCFVKKIKDENKQIPIFWCGFCFKKFKSYMTYNALTNFVSCKNFDCILEFWTIIKWVKNNQNLLSKHI